MITIPPYKPAFATKKERARRRKALRAGHATLQPNWLNLNLGFRRGEKHTQPS